MKYIAGGLAALIALIVISIFVVQQVSDGPLEFLPGGSFTTGELVEEPVADWSFGIDRPTQFELVGFGSSRTATYIMHDGVAFRSCDLGFMWNRLDGPFHYIMNLIYIFKDWHLNAVEDGRALIRIDGKIYKAQFTKVEDAQLQKALEKEFELSASVLSR